MNYKSFKISNYKGISNPVTIDLIKKSIIPIIGVNESGKTSVLEAILSFDSYNDSTNEGNHLIDTENLYDPTNNEPAKIKAGINISEKELHEILNSLLKKDENDSYTNDLGAKYEEEINELIEKIPEIVISFFVERNIATEVYNSCLNLDNDLDESICSSIIKKLPYVLYFDDFRDSIEQFIDIPEKKDSENQSKWIPYFQELLNTANKSYNIYELRNKNSNVRDSIIRSAENILQEKLTKHWSNFSLQQSAPLKVELKYHHTDKIEVRIVEKVPIGEKTEDRFFNIKNRSKGFFWYFNFIMKLEFNPKKRYSSDTETIYLLDEPGSFLHSTAQKKLCERLKSLSLKNKVIFCTHSPYLLNPENIPINNILIANKKEKGQISIEQLNKVPLKRKNAAFQPILHALQISPISLDYDKDNIVLTEGIYDYYSFEMFKKSKDLNFFPCDNALSIKHHISYMIFLGKKYSAIWDLDSDGKSGFNLAKNSFGLEESKKWGFYKKGKKRKVILQDLYSGEDLKMIKNILMLPMNSSFTKVIIALYNAPNKAEIIDKISADTKQNFENIENDILTRINL